MSPLATVLIVLGVLMLVLFVGGLIANARGARSVEESLRARIEAANEALADAHAQDKGWEPAAVEAAAREAFAKREPGVAIEELHLVQVVDRPGTDADEAVFRAVAGGRETTLTLGRRDGAWVAV